MREPSSHSTDYEAIKAIVDGWIIWRDTADWERLSAAWHPMGRMSSTRFEGLATDFVQQTKKAFAAGTKVRHRQSGFSCEVVGDRAVSITGMEITQRAELHGVEVDVVCCGYFVDFFSYREGRWAMDRRQPAYDRDRIDPVDPARQPQLDQARLATFPEPYRHLAYLQDSLGLSINHELPAARGEAFEALKQEARTWLDASLQALREATRSKLERSALPPVRRIVAADDAAGASSAAADALLTDTKNPVPGLEFRVLWATEAGNNYLVPIDKVPAPAGIVPPPGGSRFSVLDIAPGHRSAKLHKTDTLDYVLCLAGRIDVLLDAGAVTLKAGDILIQCGASHGWENNSSAPARVAVIMLDGEPKRSGSVAGRDMAP